MTEYFYTFERDGEIFDAEFKTPEEAQQWADEAYGEEIEAEMSPRNNEEFEAEIFILKRHLDPVSEEVVTDERTASTVNYTHYHGDHAEHFDQRNFI